MSVLTKRHISARINYRTLALISSFHPSSNGMIRGALPSRDMVMMTFDYDSFVQLQQGAAARMQVEVQCLQREKRDMDECDERSLDPATVSSFSSVSQWQD